MVSSWWADLHILSKQTPVANWMIWEDVPGISWKNPGSHQINETKICQLNLANHWLEFLPTKKVVQKKGCPLKRVDPTHRKHPWNQPPLHCQALGHKQLAPGVASVGQRTGSNIRLFGSTWPPGDLLFMPGEQASRFLNRISRWEPMEKFPPLAMEKLTNLKGWSVAFHIFCQSTFSV